MALHMGTAHRPDGLTLTADSRSLLLGGKPWLPVMGEFHYARYPQDEWFDELLKMKTGGIDIVATYVFWIHHEEAEGDWDWSERRSLRGFAEACSRAGLSLLVRCGPWSHGEVRNGGFPDWLVKKGYALRSDDPAYLAEARRLFAQIAFQLKGQFWKDGGPVIGIQCENEYGGPAEHLLTLKAMSREAGLDVPLYTRTGWPALSTPMPDGELLPLFGSYAEGFWNRELSPMPGKYGDSFRFLLARGVTTGAIGTDQLGTHRVHEGDNIGAYPYFCCEIGGGMASSYHRRIRVSPADTEAMALVKIGSGNNLQGYYMYHGGTNPDGHFTTLQESQATGYWNDLPVKTYDFHAPLGEFGQVNEHYHLLRRQNLFLRDWGAELAAMPPYVPAATPANAADNSILRWASRTDGKRGFVFVSNYQRLQPMPAHAGVQFEIELQGSRLRFPDTPIGVPANTSFFWPFHMDIGGADLIYATAQPVCLLEHSGTTYLVFSQTPGIKTEFLFGGKATVEAANGATDYAGGHTRIRSVRPGTDVAVRLHTPKGLFCIILLTGEKALTCWKGILAGQERLFLTPASLRLQDADLWLSDDNADSMTLSVLPAPDLLTATGGHVTARQDGIFRRFTVTRQARAPVTATLEMIQAAGPARTIPVGSHQVAEAPADADFDAAAVWRIKFSEIPEPGRDLRLRIRYVGDVARLYAGDHLLEDHFHDGDAFEFGLKRYGQELYTTGLLLKILPLRRDAPIYFTNDPRHEFGDRESMAVVKSVEVAERHEIRLHAE